MKKLLVFIFMFAFLTSCLHAQSFDNNAIVVYLQMRAKDFPDYSGTTQPVRRQPSCIQQQVTIHEGILSFNEGLSPCSISIIREDDNVVVFYEDIAESVNNIALPQLSKGCYIIQFETQYYNYCGEFNL